MKLSLRLIAPMVAILLISHTAHAVRVSNDLQRSDLTIALLNNVFDQKTITIQAGDTLIFLNQDKITHNLQFINKDGAIDDKGLQNPGVNVRETFTDPGIYKARCAISPQMTMEITVATTTTPSQPIRRIIQK